MLQPSWVAVVVLVVLSAILLMIGHYYNATYAGFIIYGAIVLAFAITVSAYSGGVRNPIAILSVFFLATLFFVSVYVYNVWGLRGWI